MQILRRAWERRGLIILSPYLLLGAALYFPWVVLKWAIFKDSGKPSPPPAPKAATKGRRTG